MHAFVSCPCRCEWSGDILILFIFRFCCLNYRGPGTVDDPKDPAPFQRRIIYLHTSYSSDLEMELKNSNNQNTN